MQGAAASAEVRRSRASPSPDKADESAKKPRLDLPDGHIKQEAVEGGDGGAIVAAAACGPRVELAARIGKAVLHCPLCTLPFKPPVYQCSKRGHLACGGCVAKLPCGQCKACADGAGFFDRCPALDAAVSSTRVECPNARCHRYVTYYQAADHQSACAHAPCRCAEPGCVYVGAPQALAGHLNVAHSVPVRAVKYGKASQIRVPMSAPRLLLLGAGDNRVFLLTVGALGAGAAAVSAVCARASAATWPRFTCNMWVNLEPSPAAAASDDRADSVRVELKMRSSTSPGAAVAAEEPTFLTVPPMYLVPAAGAAGDGAAMEMEVPLHIRIDKISPWSPDTFGQ